MFTEGKVFMLNDQRYRLIKVRGTDLVLIGIDVDRYSFFRCSVEIFLSIPGVEEVEDPYEPADFMVGDGELDLLNRKQAAIRQIILGLDQNIDYLQGKRTCPGVKEYMESFGRSKKAAHRDIRRYLQSGMDMYSLRDGRSSRVIPGESMFSGRHKGGHRFADGRVRAWIDPEKEEKYFKEGFNMIDKERSLANIVDTLNRKYYSDVILDEDGELVDIVPAPENECLSEKRFRRYCAERMNGVSLTAYRKGARERYNNDRIRFGTAQTGCTHPGAVVEIDACELDIIIVGQDRRQDLGRPVVYFAVDVYSCKIVGWYVGFENNSFLGATSLFANMLFTGERILPDSIRVDHGAEWVSKAMERIGKELGMDVSIVPPAMGSYKGLVENSFHVYQRNLRALGRKYGAIYKEYESRHYKMASTMLADIRADVENFVQTFNKKLRRNYELSEHMVLCGVNAVPEELWRYGLENAGIPRHVTPAMEMKALFSLCEPMPAGKGHSLSRCGITIKKLCYISDDPRVTELIMRDHFDTGPADYEVRRDPRTVDHIWVRIEKEVIRVPLGAGHDNLQSYKGLTWHEYEMLYDDMKRKEKEYTETERRLRYRQQELTERMLKKAKERQQELGLETKNRTDGIRDARMAAQQDERRANPLGGAYTEALPETGTQSLPWLPDESSDEGLALEDMYD